MCVHAAMAATAGQPSCTHIVEVDIGLPIRCDTRLLEQLQGHGVLEVTGHLQTCAHRMYGVDEGYS